MSDSTASERYADEATKLDEQLDGELAAIRRQADNHEITVIEAADLRVQALERHIGQISRLRAEHFGENR